MRAWGTHVFVQLAKCLKMILATLKTTSATRSCSPALDTGCWALTRTYMLGVLEGSSWAPLAPQEPQLCNQNKEAQNVCILSLDHVPFFQALLLPCVSLRLLTR